VFQTSPIPTAIKLSHRLRQIVHVGKRKVHALGTSRGHNMCCISGQKQMAKLQGLGHKAPHSGYALLQNAALGRPPPVRATQASLQFTPDAVIAPLRDILIRGALQIEPRDAWGTHAVQRKTARVVHIDQLLPRRRRLSQDAQPGEGVRAVVDAQCALWEYAAANTVEPITTCDVVTADLILVSVPAHMDARLLR